MDCEKNKYLLPTASKPLIYLRFLKSYNYTPTIYRRQNLFYEVLTSFVFVFYFLLRKIVEKI